MIELKEISKIYRSKKSVDTIALKNVNLTLADKGMVFILGKSGSGKSTLLNLLGGLDKPTSGEIFIQGKSMKDFTERDLDGYRNSFVGFVFQEFNLLEDYNVYENIELALALQQKEDENHLISQLLTSLDLEGLEKRRINELSGGQKQRVAIARALVKQPKLLLCDEPTGNLDQKSGQEIFNILKEISQQNLVVVVSHDEESARKYADRILTIVDGEILSDTGNQRQSENPSSFTLQEAHLPFSYIFRMALHNLKLKPFKLVMIIFLLTFSLLFLHTTLTTILYNQVDNTIKTMNANQDYVLQVRKVEKESAFEYSYVPFESEDIEAILDIADVTINRQYDLYDNNQELNFNYASYDINDWVLNRPYPLEFIELEDNRLIENLMGRLPTNDNEIVIHKYLADYIIKYGITENEEVYKSQSYEELLNGEHGLPLGDNQVFVVGIVMDDSDGYTTEKLYGNLKAINEFYDSDYYQMAPFIYVQDFAKNAILKTDKDVPLDSMILGVSSFQKNLRFLEKPVNVITSEGLTSKDALTEEEIIVPLEYYLTQKEDFKNQYESLLEQGKPEEEINQFIQDYLSQEDLQISLSYQENGERKVVFLKVTGVNFDNVYYITPAFGQNFSYKTREISSLYIYENDSQKLESLLTEIDLLTNNVTGNYGYVLSSDILSSTNGYQGIYTTFGKLFLFLTLAFSLFTLLLFVHYISQVITEARKEIGILRALGASSKDILYIYLTTVMIVGVFSAVLANVLWYFITLFLHHLLSSAMGFKVYPFDTSFLTSIFVFCYSLLLSVFITFFIIKPVSNATPANTILNKKERKE